MTELWQSSTMRRTNEEIIYFIKNPKLNTNNLSTLPIIKYIIWCAYIYRTSKWLIRYTIMTWFVLKCDHNLIIKSILNSRDRLNRTSRSLLSRVSSFDNILNSFNLILTTLNYLYLSLNWHCWFIFIHRYTKLD